MIKVKRILFFSMVLLFLSFALPGISETNRFFEHVPTTGFGENSVFRLAESQGKLYMLDNTSLLSWQQGQAQPTVVFSYELSTEEEKPYFMFDGNDNPELFMERK